MPQNDNNAQKRRPAPQSGRQPAPARPDRAAARPANKKSSSRKPAGSHARASAKPRQVAQPKKSASARTARPAGAPAARPAPNPMSGSIRAQTPNRRKTQRTAKRVTGSAKNLEVRHSAKHRHATYKVKKKSTASRRMRLNTLITFLIAFAVLFGAVATFFTLSIRRTHGISGSDYSVQIGENDMASTVEYTSPADAVGANGTYNVSIDRLRDYCKFTVTGDSKSLRYIPAESTGQSVSFDVGTDTAYVNGVTVRLEAKSFYYGDELYVPTSFFTRYVRNLALDLNTADNKITIVRTQTILSEVMTGTGNADSIEYEPIAFSLSADETIPNITEESVDES